MLVSDCAAPSVIRMETKYRSSPRALWFRGVRTLRPMFGNRFFMVYRIVSVGIPVIRDKSEMFWMPTRLTASISLLRSLVNSIALGKLPNKRICRCEKASEPTSSRALDDGGLGQLPGHLEFTVLAVRRLARDLEGGGLDRQYVRDDHFDGGSHVPAYRPFALDALDHGGIAHYHGELVLVNVKGANLDAPP